MPYEWSRYLNNRGREMGFIINSGRDVQNLISDINHLKQQTAADSQTDDKVAMICC